MSAYVFVAVAGGSLGLLAGGVLTQALSWNWIFFVNLPIGVLTVLLGRILIPADEDRDRSRSRRLARLAPRHRFADDRHLRDRAGRQATAGDRALCSASARLRSP